MAQILAHQRSLATDGTKWKLTLESFCKSWCGTDPGLDTTSNGLAACKYKICEYFIYIQLNY